MISSVITTAVGLAVNFISFFVLESKRVGRWALLFGGLIVMTACMLAIGLIDVIGGGGDTYSDAAGKCLTVFVALFIAGSTIVRAGPLVFFRAPRHLLVSANGMKFAQGPGVVGWAFAGEVGSPQLRAKTATLGTAGNAILGLVWTSVLPYILDADQANLGPKAGALHFPSPFRPCLC